MSMYTPKHSLALWPRMPQLSKNWLAIDAFEVPQSFKNGGIDKFGWISGNCSLSDTFTKPGYSTKSLLSSIMTTNEFRISISGYSLTTANHRHTSSSWSNRTSSCQDAVSTHLTTRIYHTAYFTLIKNCTPNSINHHPSRYIMQNTSPSSTIVHQTPFKITRIRMVPNRWVSLVILASVMSSIFITPSVFYNVTLPITDTQALATNVVPVCSAGCELAVKM